MPLTIQTDPTPLRVDEHGVIRVGDSQVLLDIVIREFHNGAEPETIAHGYPTLNLADVYGVIAYYLRHRKEIDDYFDTRRQEAEISISPKVRSEDERTHPDDEAVRPNAGLLWEGNVLVHQGVGAGSSAAELRNDRLDRLAEGRAHTQKPPLCMNSVWHSDSLQHRETKSDGAA